MGIYSHHAAEFADRGIPVFPVDTRAKRPAVKGWQQANTKKSRAWAISPKLGAAEGLGIVMGKPTGIVEVDVDAVGDSWLAMALDRFGETPITIKTASGKSKLWYRYNGEVRSVRPFEGEPIDILGGGFTIAPPSRRFDLGASYQFLSGNLDDIANLPTIPPKALIGGSRRLAETVKQGERNDSLWRWCMAEARLCDDVDALVDAAATWAGSFLEQLSAKEIERCALSAWSYESTGRNYLGHKRPQINTGDVVMDDLIDQPEAYALYMLLRRWHSNRPSFAIAPRAMSEHKNPPWPRGKIALARDVLIERGFIEQLREPDKRLRKSGVYKLSARLPGSRHNHNTPSPPYLEGL
ncbi:hypothetical protein DL1_11465 [Thioclava dalianensis]|uniref:DNA primase/polymerase bifunctional N-terminal domain-containing protein n=1 Tax=Thioclava dalianensis TaxID=1185766 RepID=A0A074THN3_9RHOB|nr:bifunctional DNA primase/polymerase [Thioclava dalianensis]KEP68548.1 hypothetical protein DL1_11465 [Thioclava dalianensis]SFN83683.1 Bifunctional DNA primase/polymerase, N-terminal [Thioclava dalianensis]